jgi:ferrochelatase
VSAGNDSRVGVLLVNLGGPENLAEVRPFLYRLFSDPDMIRLPTPLRLAVAGLISTLRAPKSRRYYRQIGGGSPLLRHTSDQARALERRLAERGHASSVYVAMRAWKPTLDEVLDKVFADGLTDLVVLPLYPQFSVSTTGSVNNELERLLERRGAPAAPRRHYVASFYDEPGYVAAVARGIETALATFPDPEKVHVLFTAHSVPVSYIKAGDPYLHQTEETVRLVLRSLARHVDHSLAYQSKVGPVKWLEPSTQDRIAELGRAGIAQVLAVPISFVSDHIETLYEVDILYKELAGRAGIRHFQRTEALGCDAGFIDALAEIVVRSIAGA